MTETMKERTNNHKISRTVRSSDGVSLYYEIENQGSAKPVIFFLHGLGGDADAWQFIRKPFLEQGYSLITMDLRGHGFSGHPRQPRSYEVDHFVEDVNSILEQEKLEKIFLAAHCFGAIIAAHFALKYPEKVSRLVLISPSYRGPNYLRSNLVKSLANVIINAAVLVSPKPFKPRHSIYPANKFHKDYEWKGLAKTILHNSWGSYLSATKQVVNLNLLPQLKKIISSTLIIVGTADSIFPLSIAEEMHREIPNSQFAKIEKANHVIVLNNAEETAGLIKQFLSNEGSL
jgi:pimeloyl-ACP methyl ester carboxylesterase